MGEWDGKAGAAQTAAELIVRLVAAVELTPLVAVSCISQEGRVSYWNRACADLYGIAEAEARDREYASLVWPLERAEEHSAVLDQVWRTGKPSPPCDWRVQSAGGRQLWIYSTLFPIQENGAVHQVCRMDVDITARMREAEALQLAAQVFEHSHEAILLTDARQQIICVNHACGAITGYAEADLLGKSLAALRGGIEDAEQFRQVWDQVAAAGHWQGEVGAVRKDGQRYPAWLSLSTVHDSHNNIRNYLLVLSDISARKQSEDHTRHLAEHDFLTDLPNRVLLLDRLSQALAAARRNGTMLALLFLDLDRFKHINDSLGHAMGDLLLKEVAARLVKCVRGVDTVSRQGGDEFVVVLVDVGGAQQVAHVAAAILHAVSQEYLLDGHRLQISVSIGISLYPGDGADIDTLMKNADLAMYHAKDGGRSHFQFFCQEMHARIPQYTGSAAQERAGRS